MVVCVFLVDRYIWPGFKIYTCIFYIEKKKTFLVPAKVTYQVAFGYCNLFLGEGGVGGQEG